MYEANHLCACLRAGSAGRDDACFVERPGGESATYGGFFATAERLAATLVAAGLTPGGRVAAQVEKSLEAVALYFATVLTGGVFLPLNPAYTTAELDYFLSDAEPAILVCDPGRVDDLTAISARLGIGQVLTLDAEGAGSLMRAGGVPAGFEAVARGPEDLAAILYTSGTTGRSKGAMLSHGNLASNAETLADCWRFTPDDVLIHALPIFHTHGLFVATNVALVAGCALVFLPGFEAERVLAAMPRATVLMGVPTFYTRLLDHPGLTRERTVGMRLFVSGSAPLLAETHARWQARIGHAILERYGMTETGMNTSNPYAGERRAGTVGFPLSGVDLRITDGTSGVERPQGEIGAIEVRGPNVFRGYWRMPEKTREDLRPDGFFVTGDLGRIDGQGYVTIVGRSKDLIITGGYNVYPKEVEALIDRVPGVRESAVIGLAHPDFGEAVAAVVVAADAGLTEAAVLEGVASGLARYKQPKRVFFAEDLPRNAMGKVEKEALRRRYAGVFGA